MSAMRPPTSSSLLRATAILLVIGGRAPAQSTGPQPAIAALVDAFRAHDVVAIAELHGSAQLGDFYVRLVRDAAFQRAANDIVVEFASGQSQPLLDEYVLEGDSLPLDTLRSIWRNTTKVASWDYPVYARWLAAIREVNLTLPRQRRIRVLAGDTPVDWTRLHTTNDWQRLGDNDDSFARIIERDVIARHRKALVVLGNNHLARGGRFRDRSPNTTTRVEARYPGSMYVALVYYGAFGDDAADARIAAEHWPAPAVVALKESWMGQRTVGTSVGALPLADFADALLYIAPHDALREERAPRAYYDAPYRRELNRRALIEWGDTTRLQRILPR